MDAIKLLERCRCAEGDLMRIARRMARRQEAVERITPTLDAVGGRGSPSTDKMTAYAADIAELEEALRQRERERQAEIAAACQLLDVLPEDEGAVLHKYYVMGYSMPGAARALHYSDTTTRRLRTEGEEHLRALPARSVAALLPDWYVSERA